MNIFTPKPFSSRENAWFSLSSAYIIVSGTCILSSKCVIIFICHVVKFWHNLYFVLDSAVTTLSGAVLLCSYLVFDSFTSNWQGGLFKQYNMTSIQMMCAVNLFSCLFLCVSLLQQKGFMYSITFMLEYPSFTVDCIMLSICSAAGQLCIFGTLSNFGPLVFTIITTIRLGFSVLLSCIIYQHHIGFVGFLGITLVFLSIALRIYCGYRVKRRVAQVN